MKLTVTQQTNEYECGVCAITSIYNYYYHQKISKEHVLNVSHINDNGLSIFDFEVLAKKFNLDCESYQTNFSELINLKISKYFIALVTKDSINNHFVICKKKSKYFIVFDSCSKAPIKMEFKKFEKIFAGIIIFIAKQSNNLFTKKIVNVKTLLLLDLKFILLNLLITIFILITSILLANFLNWIINDSISRYSIRNLISQATIFVFVYVMNDLLNYISDLYFAKQIKNYYLLFANKIISALGNKKTNFLNKIDKKWLEKIDLCIHGISSFCVNSINKFITHTIFAIICICIAASIQIYLIIFAIAILLVEFICFLFLYRKKAEIFLPTMMNDNNKNDLYKQITYFLKHEIYENKKNWLLKNIKNNWSNNYKNYSYLSIFKANNKLIKKLLKSIIEILMITTCSFLIIKQNKLSIGQLTFIIATFNLYKISLNEIFSFFLAKIEFKVYWQVYKDIVNVDNLINDNNKIPNLAEIKSINFYINNNIYKIYQHKKCNYIDLSLNTILSNCQKIEINNQLISIDVKQVYQQIIIINSYTQPNVSYFEKLISNDPLTYSQYLKHFNINIHGDFTFYKKIIINLLGLLNEKNKIIIIDDVLGYIKQVDEQIIKNLLNEIHNENDLFITERRSNN